MTITDKPDPVLLGNLEANVQENEAIAGVTGLAWGTLPKELGEMRFDLIVAADVFYDETQYDDILCTVTGLMVLTGASLFITVYRQRVDEDAIEAYFVKWGLEPRGIPEVDEFEKRFEEEKECDGKFTVFLLSLRQPVG